VGMLWFVVQEKLKWKLGPCENYTVSGAYNILSNVEHIVRLDISNIISNKVTTLKGFFICLMVVKLKNFHGGQFSLVRSSLVKC